VFAHIFFLHILPAPQEVGQDFAPPPTVIILNFCVIWSFCILVPETTGDQMVLGYSIVGKIRDLYVAIIRFLFVFPNVV